MLTCKEHLPVKSINSFNILFLFLSILG